MSASEIYDWVANASPATPDYNYTLQIKAQGSVKESGKKDQEVHEADDTTEEVVTLNSTSVFNVSWSYARLSESEAGTIMDLYHDTAKANGMARSFLWLSYDGHTYKVRFNCDLDRTRTRSQWGASEVKLKILGRIPDA